MSVLPEACGTPYYLSYEILDQNLDIQATLPSPQSYAIDMFHRTLKKHTFIRWRNLPTPVGATVSTETMYLVRMTNRSEKRSRRALRGIEYSPREYTEFHCLTRARASPELCPHGIRMGISR